MAFNEKRVLALETAESIWKDLIKKHSSEIQKVSEVLSRYKTVLAEAIELSEEGYRHVQEIKVVEAILTNYHDTSSLREKKVLLNDAYVGLIFSISEFIDELKVDTESAILEEEVIF